MDQDSLNSLNYNDILEGLGDREPSTEKEAWAFLENIRADKGYLDEETLQDVRKLRQRSQNRLLKIVESKMSTEAAYTTGVSEELYSSKYRFLFELVQNADDSRYPESGLFGAKPWMRFDVSPERFIVETNEVGFTRANVEAICATGKSSKKLLETDTHIGEKGLGFKSVFTIAEEVKIQSKVWCFCFKHRHGDNGLGMVTPLDALPETLPTDVVTRITLTYSQDMKAEYQKLVDAIGDLPDTTILFLQKLRLIEIKLATPSGVTEETRISKWHYQGAKTEQATISRTRKVKDKESTDVSKYLIYRFTKRNMPAHPRRKNIHDAKIELVFPIHELTGRPKPSEFGQYVFAYLPIQQIQQLQFIIQADFATSASREQIIDCAWNHTICTAAAEFFAEVVSQKFAVKGHELRFLWLDYIPKKSIHPIWKNLLPAIISSLKFKRILQTWERENFKLPGGLRRLPPSALHKGQPILSDTTDEIYLAPNYASHHGQTIEELGAGLISWSQIIDRVQLDLVRTQSRIKTTPQTDTWHESFARFLMTVLVGGTHLTQEKSRIWKLDLIPLSKRNQWTGAPGKTFGGIPKIYFAFTGACSIPDTIGLHLLEKNASLNHTRKQFYRALGVEDCPQATVFAKIEEHHGIASGSKEVLDQIRYVYQQGYAAIRAWNWIRVPLTSGSIIPAKGSMLYFPSEGEYDTYQLLRDHPEAARFLSREIVDLFDDKEWVEWLEYATGAQYHPNLVNLSRASLSSISLAVLKRNPSKFLPMLRAHWSDYETSVFEVMGQLVECKVPCTSGELHELKNTYLPTQQILSKLKEFNVPDNQVPVLQLPGPLDESALRSWKFLDTDCGVCVEPDLSFYGCILDGIYMDELDVEKLKQVYKCMAKLATIEDHEDLRATFENHEWIWDGANGLWAPLSQCISDGPNFLKQKTVLKLTYDDDPTLNSFFTTILGVRPWKLDDILEEIRERRGNGKNSSTKDMEAMYEFLESNVETKNDWVKIRIAFKNNELVLGDAGTWHMLRTCLWKSPFNLAGFQDLSITYPNLENFFVKGLSVKRASLAMLINEIKRMAGEAEPRIGDIRTRLIDIGLNVAKASMEKGVIEALDGLKEVKFLPKRTGPDTTELVGFADEFIIPDHKRYSETFSGHFVFLDFEVNDVQILHPLFWHWKLAGRYLSSTVREVSIVGADSNENENLSQQLQKKAYALFCCAAKHKSLKALRGDETLFNKLSRIAMYTTNEISTDLLLSLKSKPIRVKSDRVSIHHEISDSYIRVYVPSDERKRLSCYRSQLPKLLCNIFSCGTHAAFDISSILNCSLRDLDDILAEQDIPEVSWIEKPVLEAEDTSDDERPVTPTISEAATLTNEFARINLDTPVQPGRQSVQPGQNAPILTPEPRTPSHYPQLIEQVVRSARHANNRYREPRNPVARTPPVEREYQEFNHEDVFGVRETNQFAHDRRIGAAGEAYVFEILSALNLPDFSRENWRSTIRGVLSGSSRFSDIENWVGRETTDIVYTDHTGALTRYLRSNCEGGFPDQIPIDHDHDNHPIEYCLEVKSTVSACNTRFYMSNGQYQRMEKMSLRLFVPTKVYVIMRVFDLMTPNVDMKIFVDPLRFKGTLLDFEAEQWLVKTR